MAAVGPFGLGPLELVVILLVLVMLFGATRLADIGGSLGKGIREFRKNVKEGEEEEEEAPTTQASVTTAPPVPVNGAETVSAVKCPNCGALNPAGARHCNQCGTAIVAPVS
jgi:sec-independent protein translocase protein TatA